jgi:hypothetical protein
MTPAQRKRINDTTRVHQRRLRRQAGIKPRKGGGYVKARPKFKDSVPVEPFSEWIREKQAEMTMLELAHRTGVSERSLYAYRDGYDKSGKASRKAKKRKLRQVDWVSIDTVDKALVAFGEVWRLDIMYPINPHDIEYEEPFAGLDVIVVEPLEDLAFAKLWNTLPSLLVTAPNISSATERGEGVVPDVIGEYQRRELERAKRRNGKWRRKGHGDRPQTFKPRRTSHT